MTLRKSKPEILHALAERVRSLEQGHRADPGQHISSSCAALDRLLPQAAFRRSSLVEFLAAGRGSGASTLALILARQAAAEGGAVVVLDHDRSFYPPAAAALGIDLENLMVLRPTHARDHAWAFDQALRCTAVAAAVCSPGKWSDATLRRLQLAAESGAAVGLLLRPEVARREPLWADVRLLVSPLPSDVRDRVSKVPGVGTQEGRRGSASAYEKRWLLRRRLRVELLRMRGGAAGGVVELELDETTGELHESLAPQTSHVHLASALAAAAPRRRSTGA